eukprot:gnl/MRDRNA2_/MRDRNA2_192033_c0_seq1.p1 gnl/MRDRNA2_/MRDRNA2_192033_c0~~gnl/MRDRNA2_/MRDRNA2_192033_c0_seq1.p1  ORF type:complete len:280 (-),score=34.49 gnl/MRDRNA2_/MRDRNA2_192033_c0_seq1:182-940(-)
MPEQASQSAPSGHRRRTAHINAIPEDFISGNRKLIPQDVSSDMKSIPELEPEDSGSGDLTPHGSIPGAIKLVPEAEQMTKSVSDGKPVNGNVELVPQAAQARESEPPPPGKLVQTSEHGKLVSLHNGAGERSAAGSSPQQSTFHSSVENSVEESSNEVFELLETEDEDNDALGPVQGDESQYCEKPCCTANNVGCKNKETTTCDCASCPSTCMWGPTWCKQAEKQICQKSNGGKFPSICGWSGPSGCVSMSP